MATQGWECCMDLDKLRRTGSHSCLEQNRVRQADGKIAGAPQPSELMAVSCWWEGVMETGPSLKVCRSDIPSGCLPDRLGLACYLGGDSLILKC